MEIRSWFDHGLGDVVQWVALMQLYRKRGYDISCHYDKNKQSVFDAGGIAYSPELTHYHHWRYYDGFNSPDPDREGSGNKTYLNIGTEWLPDIGPRDAVWDELCHLDLEDSFANVVTSEVRADVAKFLDGVPRPIVALHTKGSNFQVEKSIPDATAAELYRLLLDGMSGSVVLLDWDYRVPMPPHARIRHVKRDWGHISTLELAGLLSASDLLIGIDSGPWHLANMTRCPALGVFHDFFPWCVSLPRPSGKNVVMTRDSHHHATVPRRRLWNPVEYAAPMPQAADIARHALRMLAGPRYGLPIGRDVMLQHLVRDLTNASTPSRIMDRHTTLDIVFREMGKVDAPVILETGCVRSWEDWSAGYGTYLFGCLIDGKGRGSVTSVDLDAGHCATARRLCEPWAACTTVIESDSVTYLRKRQEPVDLLYLDSLDCEVAGHGEHGLQEAMAGERLVKEGGLLVIDDTTWAGGWTGKGGRAVPWLLSKGWRLIGSGYQTVLQRD